MSVQKKRTRISKLLRELSDSDEESEQGSHTQSSQTQTPWKIEFDRYLDTHEQLPDNMSVIQWWGVSV